MVVADDDASEARRLGFRDVEHYRSSGRSRIGSGYSPPQPLPAHLNHEQFSGTTHGISPHQLAIPGMEEHAHPWAGPLARGHMLDYGKSDSQHHLTAVDVSDPKYPDEAAELSWTDKREKYPGEVAMVTNFRSSHGHKAIAERAKGLAGALFHSAHYWDFGQDTVPIHSPMRSDSGEHFANKVRPDLKPDVWENYVTQQKTTAPGKPPGEAPHWPLMPANIHPYQREQAEQRGQVHAAARARNRYTGQERLF